MCEQDKATTLYIKEKKPKKKQKEKRNLYHIKIKFINTV